jgi:hypothetical protein
MYVARGPLTFDVSTPATARVFAGPELGAPAAFVAMDEAEQWRQDA